MHPVNQYSKSRNKAIKLDFHEVLPDMETGACCMYIHTLYIGC